MPTDQQLLEAERDGLLSPKEQEDINQLRQAGGFPKSLGLPAKGAAHSQAPVPQPIAPVPTPTPPAEQPSLVSKVAQGAETLASESLFQGIIRPGAELNRFLYNKIGGSIIGGYPTDPKEYKAARVRAGLYGAARLPEDVPHGFLENLGAATAPLEGTLLATPFGQAVYGLGVVTRAATGDDQIADAVEGVGGMVMLGKDLYQAGKLVKRAVAPATEAEKAYTGAKELAATAKT